MTRNNPYDFSNSDWNRLSCDLSFKLFLLFAPRPKDLIREAIATLNRIGIPALL